MKHVKQRVEDTKLWMANGVSQEAGGGEESQMGARSGCFQSIVQGGRIQMTSTSSTSEEDRADASESNAI